MEGLVATKAACLQKVALLLYCNPAGLTTRASARLAGTLPEIMAGHIHQTSTPWVTGRRQMGEEMRRAVEGMKKRQDDVSPRTWG